MLAVAADSELIAAEAIEKIEIEWELLPFNVDPLDTLRSGRPNASTDGNVWAPGPPTPNAPPPAPHVKEVKWTEQDFAGVNDGHLPMGKPTDEWSYGDLEGGFRKAALVLDDTFVTPNTYHQTLESRTAMAYWQNGKVFLHCSTQSVIQTVDAVARWLHVEPKERGDRQRVYRRRVRQQNHRRRQRHHPGPPVQENQPPGHDAHQPRRGTGRSAARAQHPWPDEGRICPGRPQSTAVDLFAVMDNGPTSSSSTCPRPA